ncbi:MAG TPA: gfo/Idh/MocA family oxidoreductase, partial [Vicinamibacteria bacterium]|nr:gfo/Idh/MocA family oxidoreductase [Vicinamibacteria bacterium]
SLAWRQEEPNSLLLKWPYRPREIVRAGVNYNGLSSEALRATRLPAGHPEGYIEAFANLYRSFASTLRGEGELDCPTVHDGARGMAFIEAAVESSRANGKWTRIQET